MPTGPNYDPGNPTVNFHGERRSNAQIRDDMVEYLKAFPKSDTVEIWAYNGATDQVVMANFFGGLLKMREAFNEAGFPRVEFRELAAQRDRPRSGRPCLTRSR